ncbi:ABC transporter permease [Sinomonas sp. ASV322]|uniref:ABC transporter permease n=1 Tax=Sinomonas sp. ASV322 TaxID=3041920 RepID=UPI0027DD2220|nr:ABC transporter permease [Sinomonas sp. ASV322]MDQ4501795.1 ABC transporter permease [Sinomonas sp. ASV322]
MNLRRLTSAQGFRPEWITNNVLLVALVLLCLYFAAQTPFFLDAGNAKVVLQNNATLGIVVVALTFLVISGGVDLSVGSAVGLSGTLTALASVEWGLGDVQAASIGILAGVGVGLVNGILCGLLEFNPVIVTLGMLGAVRGLTLLIHHDQVFGLNGSLPALASAQIAGIPVIAVIALAAFAVGAIFLRTTIWGPYLFAIGTNREAAFLAGLPVRALPFALYLLSGTTAGIAGVLLAARLNGAAPGQQGINLELQALTVVLLGGVAFSGGRGRLLGVFTGWIFLGVLENGLTLTNVTPFVETLVEGLALVFAAGLEALSTVLATRLADRRKAVARLSAGPDASPMARDGDAADGETADGETAVAAGL